MNFSIRRIIRALVSPRHRISISRKNYEALRAGLEERADKRRESGAFLLGNIVHGRREVTAFVFYEELDSRAYDTGAITLDSSAYIPLFNICRARNKRVVGDVHVHPNANEASTSQSITDQANPMLSEAGHVALIVDNYAGPNSRVGVHEYGGNGNWTKQEAPYLYIGALGP